MRQIEFTNAGEGREAVSDDPCDKLASLPADVWGVCPSTPMRTLEWFRDRLRLEPRIECVVVSPGFIGQLRRMFRTDWKWLSVHDAKWWKRYQRRQRKRRRGWA